MVNSLEEAFVLKNQDKQNHILGGGAWLKLSVKEVNTLISLENLSLDYIKDHLSYIEIGALTSLRDIETSDLVKEIDSGILCQAISNIMGIGIRNLATIGGSIMGKFSFSDILPVLVVMDCKLVFYQAGEVNIQDFLLSRDYSNDLLKAIRIQKTKRKSYFKKVSKTALDFSMVTIAMSKDEDFRIAIASLPGMAVLLKSTPEYLKTIKEIDDSAIDQSIVYAMEELSIGGNIRASKEYRQTLIKTYLKRGIKQVIK